jgi:hypothetical protein
MAVLAPVLVCFEPRIAADVGPVLRRALDDVDGEGSDGEEAENEDNDPEDPEKEGGLGGGEHRDSVRAGRPTPA